MSVERAPSARTRAASAAAQREIGRRVDLHQVGPQRARPHPDRAEGGAARPVRQESRPRRRALDVRRAGGALQCRLRIGGVMTFVCAWAGPELALVATDTRIRSRAPTGPVLEAPVLDCWDAHKLFSLRAGWLAGAGSTAWTTQAADVLRPVPPAQLRARLAEWADGAIGSLSPALATYIRTHHFFWIITALPEL